MKGIILDFSTQQNTGVISGDDKQRYTFSGTEWKGYKPPIAGERVDFDSDLSNNALQIYITKSQNDTFSQLSKQLDHISDQSKPEDQYNMIDWFVKSLRNYANFTGRARRKEFWFFMLMCIIIAIAAQIIDAILRTGMIFQLVSNIALLVPSLSVGARRLHDIGRTGWWQLIMLSVVGIILLIVWWVLETDQQDNEWGPPAK